MFFRLHEQENKMYETKGPEGTSVRRGKRGSREKNPGMGRKTYISMLQGGMYRHKSNKT